LDGAFVWARRALNRRTRRVPARAVPAEIRRDLVRSWRRQARVAGTARAGAGKKRKAGVAGGPNHTLDVFFKNKGGVK
jgi:hypothetical protein